MLRAGGLVFSLFYFEIMQFCKTSLRHVADHSLYCMSPAFCVYDVCVIHTANHVRYSVLFHALSSFLLYSLLRCGIMERGKGVNNMYEIELDPEIAESVCRISENLPEINFSKQLEEMALGVAECIQTTAPQLQSLIDQATCTIQMIQDAIPNIRCIQENLSREMPEFSKSITSMMQTLDFPAVQPEITREQLKDRLENMDTETFEKTCTKAEKAVKTLNLSQKKKKSVLNTLKSGCRDIVIGVIVEIIASALIAAVHPQQTSENVVKNYITNNYYPSIATESTNITDSKPTEN